MNAWIPGVLAMAVLLAAESYGKCARTGALPRRAAQDRRPDPPGGADPTNAHIV